MFDQKGMWIKIDKILKLAEAWLAKVSKVYRVVYHLRRGY